jgi:hypothetical protein
MVFFAQFNSIHVVDTTTPKIHVDFHLVLSKHQQVFEMPRSLSPSCGEHHHSIPLIASRVVRFSIAQYGGDVVTLAFVRLYNVTLKTNNKNK